jgi:glycosyltransferase involved in cell wall biosynthesis
MILSGISAQRVFRIHNALDPKYLAGLDRPATDRSIIREEFNIPPGAFVIVMVALLRPRKGAEILIQAMAAVKAIFPNCFLLIVGNDDISEIPGYGTRLRKLASEVGLKPNIAFIGFRNDVRYILQECDLMVLPSLYGEGLPMVILEAMASGLPVIASRVEGVPEIIEDGVNGFMVNPGDAVALSRKIITLLEKPHLQIKAALEAKKKVRNMTAHKQAEETAKIYRELLER